MKTEKPLQQNLIHLLESKQLLFMFATHAFYILVCSKYTNQTDPHDQAIFASCKFFSWKRAVTMLRETETRC